MCLEVIWIEAARALLEQDAKFMKRSLEAFKRRRRTSDLRPCHEISEARSQKSDG
jgi:hypothetical protein